VRAYCADFAALDDVRALAADILVREAHLVGTG
jgi:hypothetical protein